MFENRYLRIAKTQLSLGARMDDGLTFRFAVSEDFPAVLDLAGQLAIQIEAQKPHLTLAQFEHFFIRSHSPMRLLLAVRAHRIVGMISWTITHDLYSAETRVYISDVSVDRAVRGEGVGTALMREVECWARAHNASKLGWEVWHRNVKARAFYERLGASIDHEAIPYVMPLEDE